MYQCSRCGGWVIEGSQHYCIKRSPTNPQRLVDQPPTIWTPAPALTPIIQGRKYKCGKCGSEFDTPAMRGMGREGTVCPFCGFGRERGKKNKV